MSFFNNALDRLLMEIDANDAYNKFYNHIDRSIYDQVVGRKGKLTPVTKMILQNVDAFEMTNVDLSEFMQKFRMLKPEQQLKMQNMAKANEFETIVDLIAFVMHPESIELNETYNETCQKGLINVCNNEEYNVTATLSYNANHHFFHQTRWCTASGHDGSLDGEKMFERYTNLRYFDRAAGNVDTYNVLLQFTSVKDRTVSFQVACSANGELSEICDYDNNKMTSGDLHRVVGGELWKQTIYNTSLIKSLITQMITMYAEESKNKVYDPYEQMMAYKKQLYDNASSNSTKMFRQLKAQEHKIIRDKVQRELSSFMENPEACEAFLDDSYELGHFRLLNGKVSFHVQDIEEEFFVTRIEDDDYEYDHPHECSLIKPSLTSESDGDREVVETSVMVAVGETNGITKALCSFTSDSARGGQFGPYIYIEPCYFSNMDREPGLWFNAKTLQRVEAPQWSNEILESYDGDTFIFYNPDDDIFIYRLSHKKCLIVDNKSGKGVVEMAESRLTYNHRGGHASFAYLSENTGTLYYFCGLDMKSNRILGYDEKGINILKKVKIGAGVHWDGSTIGDYLSFYDGDSNIYLFDIPRGKMVIKASVNLYDKNYLFYTKGGDIVLARANKQPITYNPKDGSVTTIVNNKTVQIDGMNADAYDENNIQQNIGDEAPANAEAVREQFNRILDRINKTIL